MVFVFETEDVLQAWALPTKSLSEATMPPAVPHVAEVSSVDKKAAAPGAVTTVLQAVKSIIASRAWRQEILGAGESRLPGAGGEWCEGRGEGGRRGVG